MSAEITYRIAFVVLLLGLLGMRVYFMIHVRRAGGRVLPDKGAIQREGGPGILAMYILGASWILALAFPLPPWLRWSGFVLGIVSVFFWTWTQVVLDTQWSAQLQLIQGHQLVTSGPYARIRHPLYTGMMGWALALALLTDNWIFLAIGALTILGVLWRVPKEEQMMVENFGEAYQDYMTHTGRFFPRMQIKRPFNPAPCAA